MIRFRLGSLMRAVAVVGVGLWLVRPIGSAVTAADLATVRAVGPEVVNEAINARPQVAPEHLFDRDNLIAWCIVPFDGKNRGPEARAAMLARLGFRHLAYDWRAEHVPTWDAEVDALAQHQVSLDAFWCPGELNNESRQILNLLARRKIHAELWVMLGLGEDLQVSPAEQGRRIDAAVGKLRPLAEAAAQVGCSVGLYNHGSWFGEPENQLAILDRLKGLGSANVGMVYNLHHAQPQVGRLAATLKAAMPYLMAINLDGVDAAREPGARKILPLAQGALDLEILRTIRASGYGGRIGILGHTNDDAEERLQDNLDGLDWLVPQLDGKPAGPRPVPKTPVAPLPAPVGHTGPALDPNQAATVTALLADARKTGDVARGATIFASSRLACLGCHKVAGQGGMIGPDLSAVGVCVVPEEIVAAVLWPKLQVKAGFEAVTLALTDGTEAKGYDREGSATEFALFDPATDQVRRVARDRVESRHVVGTLMPEGLLAALSTADHRDLIRFLIELGRPESSAAAQLVRVLRAEVPAEFPHDRAPLRPDLRLGWQEPINRDRDYDYYTKQADHFAQVAPAERPPLLPAYPGLDGGTQGHWGNQNEATWKSDQWNATDLGSVMAGVIRVGPITVPKGVCVALGKPGELAVCFDPLTATYPLVWTGGFLKFSATRYGFLDGLIMAGTAIPQPAPANPAQVITYHGFYRHGDQVIFAYRAGEQELLDAPTVADGKFVRVVGPRDTHPLRHLTTGGGPARWPDAIETQGTLGTETNTGYTVDSIEPPFRNPGKSLMFFGGLDFARDGSAYLCTMQGEVWHATGLDASLRQVRWRRIASGLHQALGLVVDRDQDDALYVLGRDQITRLHDLNSDGEADFHECVSNVYQTSSAGHDFIAGLERDPQGRFLTASGPQGAIRITPGNSRVEVLATGFRNPDGIGLGPDGTILVPSSEGDWVPASSLSQIKTGGHYGFGGPKPEQALDLPMLQLPRGLDNSAGAPVFVADRRMGALADHWVHLSFGAGTAFLLLQDPGAGVPQAAFTPLPGEFRSGSHRGRVNPADGFVYVAGMNGWGSYTSADGSFGRIRPTGQPSRLPVGYAIHADGVRVTFAEPVDPSFANDPAHQLAQAWNYHYSKAYGSPELSPSHPGSVGHDLWPVRSSQVLVDGRSLFLAIPDLQPVNVLQLHLKVDFGPAIPLFATIHRVGPPFLSDSTPKPIQPDPIVADLAALGQVPTPNPWARGITGSRTIVVVAGKNLSFEPRTLTARPGEAIRLQFSNPDVVPHNWALIQPGKLSEVGELANKLIAHPDAARLQYIPRTDAILAYTNLTEPGADATISFRAPTEPGRYPFLCTFPGHWMVMNGEFIIGPGASE